MSDRRQQRPCCSNLWPLRDAVVASTLRFSMIIHDWDRDRAVAILRNCRRAMNQTGRLLLVETVIPGPDEPHPGKIMDFIMLLGLGGQERTEQQYAGLLRESGFDLARVVPTLSPMSVIEGIPA